MKTQKLLVAFLALLIISWPSFSLAHSGCCSYHGGVCGCGCCDGSSLSATCAPYYPGCGSSEPSYSDPTIDDQSVDYSEPTIPDEYVPSTTQIAIPNKPDCSFLQFQLDNANTSMKTDSKAISDDLSTISDLKKTIENQNTWLWIIGIALVGYMIAFYTKKS